MQKGVPEYDTVVGPLVIKIRREKVVHNLKHIKVATHCP